MSLETEKALWTVYFLGAIVFITALLTTRSQSPNDDVAVLRMNSKGECFFEVSNIDQVTRYKAFKSHEPQVDRCTIERTKTGTVNEQ